MHMPPRTRGYNRPAVSAAADSPAGSHRHRSPFALARLAADRAAMRVLAWQRWRDGNSGDPARIPPEARIPFRCNVCGTGNGSTLAGLTRERITCTHCGSSVRFRAIVYLVTREVLGRPAVLSSLRRRPDIAGIGLSDAWSYAHRLARKLDYVNTHYHTEPRLDITSIGDEHAGRYDFITSSDVFEHVQPPVRRAFANARRMLKPGGKLILTVPFTLDDETTEHYPDLHDYEVREAGGRFTMTNRTRDGAVQTFTDLVFHGGPGATLEMRVFGKRALERDLLAAGFARVRVADDTYLPFGIHWADACSAPMVAYA